MTYVGPARYSHQVVGVRVDGVHDENHRMSAMGWTSLNWSSVVLTDSFLVGYVTTQRSQLLLLLMIRHWTANLWGWSGLRAHPRFAGQTLRKHFLSRPPAQSMEYGSANEG